LDERCNLNIGITKSYPEYIYKTFIYTNSIRCGLDPRYVEMGMWFFGSKIIGNNRNYTINTIKSACNDLIDRLRNAIDNTNIRNDQFKIDDEKINEDELIKRLLESKIKDELLDIIFF
jgi:hypothetical protein